MPQLDRHPDLIDRLNEMLQTPGQVAQYMDRYCRQYLLEDSESVRKVVDFVQTRPTPLPGGNATAVCVDAWGVFEGFYQCARSAHHAGSASPSAPCTTNPEPAGARPSGSGTPHSSRPSGYSQ